MTHTVKPKMGSRLARLSPYVSLLALAACSSVLGIEDLHQGPAPGSGGSNSGGGGSSNGGDNGTGGDVVGTGGANTVTGGSAGKGQGGGSAGSSVIGRGGDTGEAGAGIGVGGEGPGGTSVHGHVIDYWGHKVAGVPVEIGGTLVTTDAMGAFVVDNVAALYDASLVVDTGGNQRGIYGWVFQGLTRRDPTLQVKIALQQRSANTSFTTTGAVLNATRTLNIALAGPDGSDEFTDEGITGGPFPYWRGPATTQEQAHGLLWQFDANSLPTSYLSYDTTLVSLADTSAVSMFNLNMTAKTIASGKIGGSITAAGVNDRTNQVFLRFTSGASITLLSHSPGPDNFSYLVPTIAGGSATLAAVEGDAFYGAYAVAHKDGLAAGASSIAATIPTPAKPLAPAAGATGVNANTQFTFTAGAGNPGAYVVIIDDQSFFNALYVVTTKKTFKLPVVASGGYTLSSGDPYVWRVETHDSFATVDSMTGPTGFMDEFSGDEATPTGPRSGDGSYTISFGNGFTAQ